MANIGQSAATGATVGGAIGSVVPGVGTAIGAGAGALVGLGTGIYQYAKGKKLENSLDRPEYKIPDEVMQNLSIADRMALQGLPEEQKQQYLQNLQRGTAYGLSQIGSRKGGLVGLASLNEQQNQGYANLLAQDAEARMKNQQLAMGQRQNVADYKEREWQYNQYNPYMEDMAKAQALQGAGMQNIYTGIGNVGYGLGSAYDAYANKGATNAYNTNPQNGLVGYTAQGQQVQAMPGVNPYNANQQNTAPLNTWGKGLVATPPLMSASDFMGGIRNSIPIEQQSISGSNVPNMSNQPIYGLQGTSPSTFRF